MIGQTSLQDAWILGERLTDRGAIPLGRVFGVSERAPERDEKNPVFLLVKLGQISLA